MSLVLDSEAGPLGPTFSFDANSPLMDDVRISSWNGKACFPADYIRANTKLKGLKRLLLNADVVCLQETHFSHRSVHAVRKLCDKIGCFIFAPALSQSAGGVGIINRKRGFLGNAFFLGGVTGDCSIQTGSLTVCWAEGRTNNFYLLLVSSYGSWENRFIKARFTKSGYQLQQHNCRDDVDYPTRNSDVKVREFWQEHFWDYEDVSRSSSLTYFGPEHSSRLDRIYIKSEFIPKQLFRVASHIEHGFRVLSDHVPVSVKLMLRRSPGSYRIPSALISNPLFAQHVQELWGDYEYSASDPWAGLSKPKHIFKQAASFVKKTRWPRPRKRRSQVNHVFPVV